MCGHTMGNAHNVNATAFYDQCTKQIVKQQLGTLWKLFLEIHELNHNLSPFKDCMMH